MSYEYFEHQADIGVRGVGATLVEAFEQVALAMFEIMVETKDLQLGESDMIEIKASNREELLLEWLSELLYLKDVEGKMYGRFKVEKLSDTSLVAKIYGEPIDIDRHKLKLEVKAATWTQLQITQTTDNKWIAQCLVDV
ncbi:MAG: archease [Candidatus Heimdallarchaeota archaeon]